MPDLINQPAVRSVKIAILGALHAVEADLRLVAQVGAEHALQKAAIEFVIGIENEFHRVARFGAALTRVKRRHKTLVTFKRDVEHLLILRRRLAGDDWFAALRLITVVEYSQLVVDDVAVADHALHRPWPLVVDVRIEHRTGTELNHSHLAARLEHGFMDDTEHLSFGHAALHPLLHGANADIS